MRLLNCVLFFRGMRAYIFFDVSKEKTQKKHISKNQKVDLIPKEREKNEKNEKNEKKEHRKNCVLSGNQRFRYC